MVCLRNVSINTLHKGDDDDDDDNNNLKQQIVTRLHIDTPVPVAARPKT